MTAKHPRRTSKSQPPRFTPAQIIGLLSTTVALIQAIAYLVHG
jgi:hypothetical protein